MIYIRGGSIWLLPWDKMSYIWDSVLLSVVGSLDTQQWPWPGWPWCMKVHVAECMNILLRLPSYAFHYWVHLAMTGMIRERACLVLRMNDTIHWTIKILLC